LLAYTMENVAKKIGEMALETAVDSSTSAGEDSHTEEESEDNVNPMETNQEQFNRLSLELNTRENSGRPTLQSWASEMSLLDKMSPRWSMDQVKFPSTPAVVPTPKEFKGINWKKMTFDNNNKTRIIKTEQKVSDGIIAEEEEDDQELQEEDTGRNSYSHKSSTDETPGRFEIVEDERSEISKPSTIKSDQATSEPIFDHKNLIVNYLPPDMDSIMLRDLFAPHGTIVSCKVIVDHASGLSKGFGFVKFQNAAEGIKAQGSLHQHQIGRKTLKVSFSRRPQSGERTKHHTNLYFSNLDPQLKDEELEKQFKTCGYVVQCKILKNKQGKSKQIGFVRFDNAESAQRAIDRFDGTRLEGTDRPIKIRIAGTPRAPPGREALATHSFASVSPPHSPPRVYSTSSACYVAGFDVSVSEKVLRRIFEPSGGRKVKSVRIIRRQNGPYAFINFFNCEDAAEAARTLNNYNLGGSTLTVRLQS